MCALAGGTTRFSQTPSIGPLCGRTLRVSYVFRSHCKNQSVERLDPDVIA
jgi:hypothetical protein